MPFGHHGHSMSSTRTPTMALDEGEPPGHGLHKQAKDVRNHDRLFIFGILICGTPGIPYSIDIELDPPRWPFVGGCWCAKRILGYLFNTGSDGGDRCLPPS